ncbi:MAG: AarF/ABC1/UbiB kinase family protein [Planctomycetota bacterium]|nr:AarF/ABC1/UbiB kinase family protein [Planctomycetota bacterium]
MSSPLAFGRTIRSTQRTRDILVILARYGFAGIIQELNLDRLLLRSRKLVGAAEPDEEVTRQPTEVRLRRAMEELGPTFIKLGQVLSMRPDLVPPGWAEEFEQLQDEVPPVAFEGIQKRLEEEFGERQEELFDSIEEEPLAAASIAQVHRAVLRGGRPIVLKVLRPGIRDKIASDMDILRRIAEFAEAHFSNLGYSPTEVVDQFSRELKTEIDLTHEARAADRLRRNFIDNEHVHFPEVFWEATTSSVLAMEEIRGTLLSKMEPEELSEADRQEIVARGTDAVFRQCLEHGFFHADPHPGNIFILPGAEICFIDCGMVGHVDPETAGLLADLVHGVIEGDLNRVIDVTLTLGGADPALAEDRAFRADTWEYISRFEQSTFDKLDMGRLLQDFFDRIRRHRLRCPSDIVFLIKAITTIEGIGERLMPDFDIATHVEPYVQRLVRRRYGIGALRSRLQTSVLGYAQVIESLPRHVRSLLHNIRRNRVTVHLEHHGLHDLTQTIERASANVAHAVFVAALILGSSILVLADSTTGEQGVLSILAIIGFAVAIVLTVGRVLAAYFR